MRLSRFWVKILGCLSTAILLASCSRAQNVLNQENVILITLDGVRWQEVFHGTDPVLDHGATESVVFEQLTALGSKGVSMGDRNAGSEVLVSNPTRISLPAYQSIMAGAVQACWDNSCVRVPVPTLAERIRKDYGLEKTQVATLASWSKIALAVEHEEGATLVNAGNSSLDDGTVDSRLGEMNASQNRATNPWGEKEVRMDKFTMDQALYYLEKHQPKFLYVSLNDSDEWAHQGNYPEYISTLHEYDRWIGKIVNFLETRRDYGSHTTLIITTDHGRGDGTRWTDHGPSVPEAQHIWMVGRNPKVGQKPFSSLTHSHLSIRPTIEAILGLSQSRMSPSASVIQELVPSNPESSPIERQ